MSQKIRDWFFDARQSKKRPAWITESQWDGLLQIWDSPEFKERSRRGKASRASMTGGSSHTQGSKSAAQIEYEMVR